MVRKHSLLAVIFPNNPFYRQLSRLNGENTLPNNPEHLSDPRVWPYHEDLRMKGDGSIVSDHSATRHRNI